MYWWGFCDECRMKLAAIHGGWAERVNMAAVMYVRKKSYVVELRHSYWFIWVFDTELLTIVFGPDALNQSDQRKH